jgi:hypothetical protein
MRSWELLELDGVMTIPESLLSENLVSKLDSVFVIIKQNTD